MFGKLFVFGVVLALGFLNAKATTVDALALPDSNDAILSGYVKDSASGETIIGAKIQVRALKRGAVTNKSGYFALYLPSGVSHIVEVSSIGYAPSILEVRLNENQQKTITFILSSSAVMGQEVVVQTDREKEMREAPQVSRVSIQPAQVAMLPKAGEADLFRILQLIPGVQTISELSSGLYVRGGSPDQNLILLDGSTLYNPSHFFGFFSTFNSDAIKDVDLIKGGFPAQYGGRLSAVLNVTNKDGDLYNTHGKFSLGLISSRASIETPIGNGALSLSGRRTYIDLILDATGLTEELEIPSYRFYDLNGKFTQDLGDFDKIAVSGYGGSDALSLSSDNAASRVSVGWGNQAGSVAWTHIFASNLFSRFAINGSHYFSLSEFGLGDNSFTFDNDIRDYSLHGDIEWFSGGNNLLKTGFQLSQYEFKLNIKAGNNPPNADIDLKPIYWAAYVSDEWKPNEEIAVTAGLRVDGITSNGDIGIDPRISARYILNENVTLKASYGIYHQYLKLATNPLFTAFDLWMPVDSTQAASKASQYVLGVATVPWEGYSLEVEAYYKDMSNLVEIKPNIVTGNSLDDIFFLGNGYSYGLEFFLQKQIGDLTGWIGYTLAYNRRTFPAINDGETFPPIYDRRNDLNIVGTYRINDRWTVGSAFIYATGQSYSQTTAYYVAYEPDYAGKPIPIEGSKNGLRLPPYHRLDLSATYSFGLFSDTRNAELNIDIYNVYNHRNVWVRRTEPGTNPPKVEDIKLLPILPTFGIQVKF